MDHAEVMNSCNSKAQLFGVASLNPVERTIYMATWAEFEITLGEIDTFYYNSAGNDAVEMVSALRSIGALQAAEALEAANALFPNGAPSRSREQRFDELLQVRDLPGDQLSTLTSAYYKQSPGVHYMVERFIEAHAVDLREHWDGSPLDGFVRWAESPKPTDSTRRS